MSAAPAASGAEGAEPLPASGGWDDAVLAARLFAADPQRFGGMVLRGAGPAREALLDCLRGFFAPGTPWRRLPASAGAAELQDGIDIAASLAAGRSVLRPGLLAQAAGGVLLVPLAERLAPDIAGQLAQALEGGGRAPVLLLLDDGAAPDERPPAALTERLAFALDLAALKPGTAGPPPAPAPLATREVDPGDDEALAALAGMAAMLGIDTARALRFALAAARGHAALEGRKVLAAEDLAVAVRLVLAPRATRVPQAEDTDAPVEPSPPEAAPPPPADEAGDNAPEDGPGSGAFPEELLLEAALASLRPDLLARLAEGRRVRGASGSGSGAKRSGALRGRALAARAGLPRGGARLALIDTLRAAVPWQAVRRREAGEVAKGVLVRRADLRVRRFEERAATVTVFLVDASGSAAATRLAEAKGAVELLLAQAYVQRSEVALVAFRGPGAEVLLPPTRSLTRARRALGALPGGGGTPLAAGIAAGLRLAGTIAARGATPFLVFLTDGSANLAADGTPGRARAREDALAAGRAVAAKGLAALVIDISPQPRPDARLLAEAMRARYLPLPLADAARVQRAVAAAQPGGGRRFA